MDASGTLRRSVWRRLAVCLAVLAVVDHAVVPVLNVAEVKRYESDVQVRFENSDLFLLGPLAQYLQEHPVGPRPRAVFFGNSVIWGYALNAQAAIPSQFQRLAPDVRVLNFGVNGFETGSAYLMSKAIIDAVDAFYLFPIGDDAHSLLPKLIEVSAEDAQRFNLTLPSRFERAFDRLIGFWRLRRYSYRLQGAWFGTSSRQYVYLHKGEWVRRLLGQGAPGIGAGPEGLPPAPRELAGWDAPVAEQEVSPEEAARLAGRYPLVWEYAQLLQRHRKYGAIVELARGTATISREDRGLLNAYFHPYVIVAQLSVPDSWFIDNVHCTEEGTLAVAWTLYEHTAKAFGLREG